MENVPDVQSAVSHGALPIESLWEVRQSADGGSFRSWFHEAVRKDPNKAATRYLDAVVNASPKGGWPVRVLRFVTVQAFGALNPVAGLGANVIDSTLVKRVVQGYSPKFLIDRLKR